MFDRRTTIVMVSLIAFSMFYTTFFMDISDARLTGNQLIAPYSLGGGSGGTFFANGTNHTECIGNACVIVSGNGTNECQTNWDCMRFNVRDRTAKHTECFVTSMGHGYCAIVNGTGSNECALNNSWQDCNKLDCPTNGSTVCSYVAGSGPDLCGPMGSYCGNQTYNICQNNACVTVNGTGTNQCWSNADCNNSNSTMPDLIIDSWTWWSTGNVTNSTGGNQTNVTIRVGIKNVGTVSAGSSYTLINGTSYNWIFYGEPDYMFIYTPTINVGQVKYVQHDFIFTSGLSYVGIVSADATYLIQELDEINNNQSIWLNP